MPSGQENIASIALCAKKSDFGGSNWGGGSLQPTPYVLNERNSRVAWYESHDES